METTNQLHEQLKPPSFTLCHLRENYLGRSGQTHMVRDTWARMPPKPCMGTVTLCYLLI